MKKTIFLLLLFLPFIGYSYEQNGFSAYKENGNLVEFSCNSQCIIAINNIEKYSNIYISGNIEGTGGFSYGFIVEGRIFPGNTTDIKGSTRIDAKFESEALIQYGRKSKLLIVIKGNIDSKNLSIDAKQTRIKEIITRRRNEFWTMDKGYNPYTINTLKSPTVLEESVNIFFYIIILIVVCGMFIFYGRTKKTILYSGLVFFIFRSIYEARMGIETINYYRQDYIQYIKPQTNKNYRDRDDFYEFIYFTKKQLAKLGVQKEEPISFISNHGDTFLWISKYILYPYNNIERNKYDSKYFIIYQNSKIEKNSKELVINNIHIGSGIIQIFSDNAFIFIKNN